MKAATLRLVFSVPVARAQPEDTQGITSLSQQNGKRSEGQRQMHDKRAEGSRCPTARVKHPLTPDIAHVVDVLIKVARSHGRGRKHQVVPQQPKLAEVPTHHHLGAPRMVEGIEAQQPLYCVSRHCRFPRPATAAFILRRSNRTRSSVWKPLAPSLRRGSIDTHGPFLVGSCHLQQNQSLQSVKLTCHSACLNHVAC